MSTTRSVAPIRVRQAPTASREVGGEEGRALLQGHVDLAVDDPVLPQPHLVHPALAIIGHHRGEPARLARPGIDQPRIADPGHDEEGERNGVERCQSEHGTRGSAAGGRTSRAIRLEDY